MQWVLAIAAVLFYAIGLPVALVMIVVAATARARARAGGREPARRCARHRHLCRHKWRKSIAQQQVERSTSTVPRARPRPGLEALIGGRWLTWIGVLAIFFGTAFFVAMDLRGSPLGGVLQVLVGLVVALRLRAGGPLAGAPARARARPRAARRRRRAALPGGLRRLRLPPPGAGARPSISSSPGWRWSARCSRCARTRRPSRGSPSSARCWRRCCSTCRAIRRRRCSRTSRR